MTFDESQPPTSPVPPDPHLAAPGSPAAAPPGLPPAPPTFPLSEPPRRRRNVGLVIGVAVVLALVIGGGIAFALVTNHRADLAAQERREKVDEAQEQAEKEAAEKAAAEAESERQRQEQEAAELAAAQSAYDSCRSEVDPFLKAMKDVDARLDVGLNQDELSDLVGDASVAYSRMDIPALGTGGCLTAAAKLETAFNGYAKSVNRWNDCIFDDSYCTLDDIDGELQTQWLKASVGIDRAEEILAKLDPANGGDGVGDQI